MIKNGFIPEEITYISVGERKISNVRWDDLGALGEVVAAPAFISDSNNDSTIHTGLHWAEQILRREGRSSADIKQEKCKNSPIKGIRIVSLEQRAGGGRAYKVITPSGYYCDLREDVLLDTMMEVGVKKNAELNGEFIWGRVASQMKLIRVGSELHKALDVSGARRTMKKIPSEYLKFGHVYASKNGVHGIYLGLVNGIEYDFNNNNSAYTDMLNSAFPLIIKPRHIKKRMLWIIMPRWQLKNSTKTPTELAEEMAKGPLDRNQHAYRILSTHAFVEEVGSVDIPNDILPTIRKYSIKYSQKLAAINANRSIICGPLRDLVGAEVKILNTKKYYYKYLCALATVHRPEEKITYHDDIIEILQGSGLALE